jgi:hypothetical protein
VPSPEDQEHIQRAHACVRGCHLEHLINESKFLRLDSLQELVKVYFVAYAYPFKSVLKYLLKIPVLMKIICNPLTYRNIHPFCVCRR